MTRPTPIARATRTLLLITPVLLFACGGVEQLEGEVGSLEQAYKHGPPPGPPPYAYFLTSYGGAGDPAANGTPACGGRKIDGTWYYATGAYTFGCNNKLRIQANGKCVVVKVVDNGPAGWVETKAQAKCGGTGYIIDASPLVSKHLFGTGSAGWSDCFGIQVTPVPPETPEGPAACNGSQPPPQGPTPDPPPTHAGFIGDPCGRNEDCSTGLCLTEHDFGFPGGMCSQECDHMCPDHPNHPLTFCVKVPWENKGFCHSRRDVDMYGACDPQHPECGCRQGYVSIDLPRMNQQPAYYVPTCVPQGHNYSTTAAGSGASLDEGGAGGGAGVLGGCSVGGGERAGGGVPAVLLLLVLGLIGRGRGRR